MRRARLDAELVRRGLARSREHAAELVQAGRVRIGGQQALKPATAVSAADPVVVADLPGVADEGWASRGAHKLLGALDAFPAVQVEGRRCLDAGASTGGFTDVLLRRGALEVVCVDVGYGQLVWRLQSDPRVRVVDRTNVRTLQPEDIGGRAQLTLADLSFISLTLVLPALSACTEPDGDQLLMVKPQFEVGRQLLGSGGVVRDPSHRAAAVQAVVDAASAIGWGLAGCVASPLPGPSGNVEFFVWLRRNAEPDLPQAMITAAVQAGPS